MDPTITSFKLIIKSCKQIPGPSSRYISVADKQLEVVHISGLMRGKVEVRTKAGAMSHLGGGGLFLGGGGELSLGGGGDLKQRIRTDQQASK